MSHSRNKHTALSPKELERDKRAEEAEQKKAEKAEKEAARKEAIRKAREKAKETEAKAAARTPTMTPTQIAALEAVIKTNAEKEEAVIKANAEKAKKKREKDTKTLSELRTWLGKQGEEQIERLDVKNIIDVLDALDKEEEFTLVLPPTIRIPRYSQTQQGLFGKQHNSSSPPKKPVQLSPQTSAMQENISKAPLSPNQKRR